MDKELVMRLLDFGVTALLAFGLLWMYWKRMGEITKLLGEILGLLRAHDRSMSNLVSHLEDEGGGGDR